MTTTYWIIFIAVALIVSFVDSGSEMFDSIATIVFALICGIVVVVFGIFLVFGVLGIMQLMS